MNGEPSRGAIPGRSRPRDLLATRFVVAAVAGFSVPTPLCVECFDNSTWESFCGCLSAASCDKGSGTELDTSETPRSRVVKAVELAPGPSSDNSGEEVRGSGVLAIISRW